MALRTLAQLDCKGKYAIVRVNYDVTYDSAGKINDDSRLRKSLPTIEALLRNGASKVILLSHMGRPEAGTFDAQFSLGTTAKYLEQLLGESVGFVPEWDLRKVTRQHLPTSRIVLLENTRFSLGEKKNDPAFAQHLASLGDCYVNDAFPAMHRADASIAGIPVYLPAAAGLLTADELLNLTPLLQPAHPYYAFIAGAKADKMHAISDLFQRADKIAVGGVLANTFLAAKGIAIGSSKYDVENVDAAKDLIGKYGDRLVLPVDVEVKTASGTAIVIVNAIPADASIVDVGPSTSMRYRAAFQDAKTLLWCGPPGMFDKGYERGTRDFAELMLQLTRAGAKTVVGGGESSEAAVKYSIVDQVSFNSTGGGVTLQLAQGTALPGIVALEENLKRFR